MCPLIRVSVVVATYNGASFVGDQLLSWLELLTDQDEIVVSDDESSDSTRSIVSSFGDDRIRLLPPGPRLGYQGNFERAISSARGQFIFFSDQDDICLPDRIDESLAALRKHSCVFGDARVVDENLNTVMESYFALRKPLGFGAIHLFLRPAAIGATMACTRSFINFALPFPRNIPHDHWLSVLAAVRGELGVVDRNLILYRRHSSALSSTAAKSQRRIKEVILERVALLYEIARKFYFL